MRIKSVSTFIFQWLWSNACICDKVLAIYLFELLFSLLPRAWREEGFEAVIYNRIDMILEIAMAGNERILAKLKL